MTPMTHREARAGHLERRLQHWSTDALQELRSKAQQKLDTDDPDATWQRLLRQEIQVIERILRSRGVRLD